MEDNLHHTNHNKQQTMKKTLATFAAVASATLFAGALTLVTPEAKAWGTSCSTYGNTTYCNGSSGSSSYSTYGNTTY